MTTGLYFLKLELNYLKDATFNTAITDTQRWRYVQLYMLAKELNSNGSFVRHGKDLSLVDIAWYLHIDLDQLELDMDAIRGIGLITENGHGPCLARFVKEQETPRADAERKSDQRMRDKDKSQGSHKPVTTRVIESESESESESDIESSVKEISHKYNDDDHLFAERKNMICTHAGIPPKYSRYIISNMSILPEDILAELARNYSRKGKVKNPGYITGLNLAKPQPEKAAAEWYNKYLWLTHLPPALREELDLVYPGEEEEIDNLPIVATRNEINNELCAPEPLGWTAWQSALELLQNEIRKDIFQKYLSCVRLINYLDGVFTIGVWGDDKVQNRDWLENRLSSTAVKLLMGIMNRQDITIIFVVEEGTS